MSPPTPVELEAARAAGRWRYLWQAALPVAAAALRRRVKQGRLGAFDEDLAQSVYLALEAVVRRWDPAQAAFTTFVSTSAGWLAANAQKAHGRRGFTGVPAGETPEVLSLDQPVYPLRDSDRAGEDPVSLHEVVGYETPPRGYEAPEQALEARQTAAALQAAIASLAPAERTLLRQALGGPVAVDLPAWTVSRRVAATMGKLKGRMAA